MAPEAGGPDPLVATAGAEAARIEGIPFRPAAAGWMLGLVEIEAGPAACGFGPPLAGRAPNPGKLVVSLFFLQYTYYLIVLRVFFEHRNSPPPQEVSDNLLYFYTPSCHKLESFPLTQ